MKIKETNKYSCSFFSNGNNCEISSYRDTAVNPGGVRIPLNIKEAEKLYGALGKWLQKRKGK